MSIDSTKSLTCILENGDEKTMTVDADVLFDFVKWFKDSSNNNCYDIVEGSDKRTTMFKNTILAIRY